MRNTRTNHETISTYVNTPKPPTKSWSASKHVISHVLQILQPENGGKWSWTSNPESLTETVTIYDTEFLRLDHQLEDWKERSQHIHTHTTSHVSKKEHKHMYVIYIYIIWYLCHKRQIVGHQSVHASFFSETVRPLPGQRCSESGTYGLGVRLSQGWAGTNGPAKLGKFITIQADSNSS